MTDAIRRGRLLRRVAALVAAAALLMGLVPPNAALAAPPPLPACVYKDVLTAHTWYADYPRSLLDTIYKLPSSYAPGDLRNTSTAGLNGGYYVRKIVITDLKAMAAAAKAAGARFSVQSAYRSYSVQRQTFDYWVRVHGYTRALTESARAGHSEHQLGTTVDLKSYGGIAPWDVKDWATSKAGAWLKTNAWKYGFVMTYPKGKEKITCYDYEPWHYRYVGRAQAKAVRDSGLTMREFLWRAEHPA